MNPIQAWKTFQDQSLYYQAVKKDGEESCWQEIARDYDRIVYPGNQQDALISRLVPRIDGLDTAIEIGAGTGTLTLPLAKRLRKITAVEPSPAMAKILSENLVRQRLKNVTLARQRWEETDLPPADAVIAGGCLYAFYEIDKVLLKMLATARSKVLITHIGNEGMLAIDRRVMEFLDAPEPFLFPSLSLVTEILLHLHIPATIETFFLKTKKVFTPEQWIKRCQRLFAVKAYQHPLLLGFLEKECEKKGALYHIEEDIPAAIIELRVEH